MAVAASAASAAAARLGSVLSDAQYFESGMVRVEDIRRLLDSKSLKDKLDAMKRVVALISLGRDASVFFPDVVKNVVAPSLDVKKLVYLYLVHYAEDKQDLALLSINSFQKDLSDHNELIRALALRVLSSIRVKVILQIVILAISKCAKDPSPYVRKTAAHAICKVIALDPPSREVLMEPLSTLLNDRSAHVIGAAVSVLDTIAPGEEAYEHIHSHYRYMCRNMLDLDPHGQVATIRLLMRYARVHFRSPAPMTTQLADSGGFATDMSTDTAHPDLQLFLDSLAPLSMARQPSVAMAVISAYYHLASVDDFRGRAVLPLMRLVSSSEQSVQCVALTVAVDVVNRDPGLLLPFLTEFFVSSADGTAVRDQKLAILTGFCETAGMPSGLSSDARLRRALLVEFKSYLYCTDKALAAAATRAMGCLAAAHDGSISTVIGLLASVVASTTNAAVVAESVTVLRRLLQLHPSAQAKALPKLVALLLMPKSENRPEIEAPEARAAIIWLIGEFYEKAPHIAPEALRLLARGFSMEKPEAKVQILNLAAKVVSWSMRHRESPLERKPVPFEIRLKLLEYVTTCAMYDEDYDVRDKARVFRHLFLGKDMYTSQPEMDGICDAILGDGKAARSPVSESMATKRSPLESGAVFDIEKGPSILAGSMSHVLKQTLPDCASLPEWSNEDAPSVLRDEDEGNVRTGGLDVGLSSMSSADFRGGGVSSATTGIGPGSFSSAAGLGGSQSVYDNVVAMGGHNGGGYQPSQGTLSAFAPTSRRPGALLSTDKFYGGDDEEEEDDDSDDDEYETETDSEEEEDATTRGALQRGSEAQSGPTQLAALVKNVSAPQKAVDALPASDDASSLIAFATSGLVAGQGSKAAPQSSAAINLADLSLTSSGQPASREAQLGQGVSRKWHHLVDGWKCGGIEIAISYPSGVFEGGPNATPFVLRLTNCAKEDISNVELNPSAPDRVVFSGGRVPPLTRSQSVEVGGYCMFGGKTSSLQLKIVANSAEVGTVSIRPTAGEILRPWASLSPSEYAVRERALGGMFSCKANTEVSHATATDVAAKVRSRVLATAFMAEIGRSFAPPSIGAQPALLFAGYLPKSTEPAASDREEVLVRVVVGSDDSDTDATVWVGCENVVYANTLLQLLRRSLKEPESAKS